MDQGNRLHGARPPLQKRGPHGELSGPGMTCQVLLPRCTGHIHICESGCLIQATGILLKCLVIHEPHQHACNLF